MISIIILFIYITVRIGLHGLWDQISVYYSYLFEIIFVLTTYLYYFKKKKIQFKLNFSRENIFRIIPWIFVGFIVHALGRQSGILIPFDFKSLELILMLLIIGPILEEFIFRMSLWEAIDDLTKNSELQIWISAILFSIGHLISIFMISSDYRPFVLFQGTYVVILSIGASKMRQESKSLMGPILVHFMFNLGFYLASLY